MGAQEDSVAAQQHLAFVKASTNDAGQIKAAEDNATRAIARAVAEQQAQQKPPSNGKPAAPAKSIWDY